MAYYTGATDKDAFKLKIIAVGHGCINPNSDDAEIYINSLLVGVMKGEYRTIMEALKRSLVKRYSIDVTSLPKNICLGGARAYQPFRNTLCFDVVCGIASFEAMIFPDEATAIIERVNIFVAENFKNTFDNNNANFSSSGCDLGMVKFKKEQKVLADKRKVDKKGLQAKQPRSSRTRVY